MTETSPQLSEREQLALIDGTPVKELALLDDDEVSGLLALATVPEDTPLVHFPSHSFTQQLDHLL
jgi:hypothetical protein